MLILHVIFGETLIVTIYSPDGIYTALRLQTTLVIAARTDPSVAIFMSVKTYGSLLNYGQFDCVLNPFPANAFPLIRSGGLFFSSRSLLHPHTLTHTRTHTHTRTFSPSRQIQSGVEMKATELIALASIYWCGRGQLCSSVMYGPAKGPKKKKRSRKHCV